MEYNDGVAMYFRNGHALALACDVHQDTPKKWKRCNRIPPEHEMRLRMIAMVRALGYVPTAPEWRDAAAADARAMEWLHRHHPDALQQSLPFTAIPRRRLFGRWHRSNDTQGKRHGHG